MRNPARISWDDLAPLPRRQTPSWPHISWDGRPNAYLGTFKPSGRLAAALLPAKPRRGTEPLVLEKMDRLQAIEFACYSFFAGGKRGPAASLYSRGNAVALLELTSNFYTKFGPDLYLARGLTIH